MQEHQLMELIKKWVSSLINRNPDRTLFSPNFLFENGLYLDESISYEQAQYVLFSDKYDLNLNFKIAIDAVFHNKENGKYQVYYKVINSKNIAIFKWYITLELINDLFYISSNNYLSQIVHKYKIDWDFTQQKITGLNLAIKLEQDFTLKNILSTQLELENISQPSSFSEDGFLLASFLIKDDEPLDKELKLKMVYMKNNKQFIENRKLPLSLDIPVIPFEIKNNNLHIKDETYPFHLYIQYHDYKEKNFTNPRDLIIPIYQDIKSIIITDCLDNDWNIFSKHKD